MKKIRLRTIMLAQSIVAFCIPLYYHLMMVYGLHSNVPLFVAIILLLTVVTMKGNSEVVDEYAKRTLQLADAVCFKIAVVIMGIIVLPFLFMGENSSTVIGYLLTLGIFLLILIRACIFLWVDKNGME